MITNNSEREYCMSCGKENPQDREKCECGGRNFVFGSNFEIEDNKVVCSCGCDKFTLTFRLNRSPIHDKTYVCTNCGNMIGIQVYVENDYC